MLAGRQDDRIYDWVGSTRLLANWLGPFTKAERGTKNPHWRTLRSWKTLAISHACDASEKEVLRVLLREGD